MHTSKSDTELILASREDASAFRELYERHATDVLAYFYKRTLDPHASADLMAETFAVAFERRASFRDQGRPGASWIYGIARREMSRYRRKWSIEARALSRMGAEMPSLDDASIERIEALAEIDSYRRQLVEAVGHLGERQRDALRLRIAEGLDYRSVGARLGCSEGAARVIVHRALSRLADHLEVVK